MLGRCRDDVARRMLEGDALDREVVRLGGARGEDDLVGLDVQRRGDRRAGAVDRRVRGVAERVAGAGGVAEHVGEVGQHRREHARIDRRRRVAVEIDRCVRAHAFAPAFAAFLRRADFGARPSRLRRRLRRSRFRRAFAARAFAGWPRPSAAARPRARSSAMTFSAIFRSAASPPAPAPGRLLCQTSGCFLQQDVAERAVALHAVGRERGDVDGAGPLVLVLDQQPRLAVLGRLLAGPPRPPALGAHEHPGAFQLEAVERHLEIALGQRRVDVVDLGRPRAAIPQHHHAGAVALRDHALELAVLDRVILDVHRQPLVGGVDRRALRHRPRQQHAVVLDAEVVVQRGGEVFLHAEEARLAALGLPRPDHRVVAGGLRRAAEVALLAIGLERHSAPLYPASPASRYAVACHEGRGSRRERAGLAGTLGAGRSGRQGGAAVGQRRRHAPAVGQGRVALDRRRRSQVARLARRHRRRPRAPARRSRTSPPASAGTASRTPCCSAWAAPACVPRCWPAPSDTSRAPRSCTSSTRRSRRRSRPSRAASTSIARW